MKKTIASCTWTLDSGHCVPDFTHVISVELRMTVGNVPHMDHPVGQAAAEKRDSKKQQQKRHEHRRPIHDRRSHVENSKVGDR
jgi:hypothetical protein